ILRQSIYQASKRRRPGSRRTRKTETRTTFLPITIRCGRYQDMTNLSKKSSNVVLISTWHLEYGGAGSISIRNHSCRNCLVRKNSNLFHRHVQRSIGGTKAVYDRWRSTQPEHILQAVAMMGQFEFGSF